MILRRVTLALVASTLVALSVASTAQAAHAVRNHGSGTIMGTYWADFDAGSLNPSGYLGLDLKFEVVSATKRFLNPGSPAQILKMGSSKPSHSKCSSATLLDKSYNIKGVSPGTWFCFRTGEGRFVRFRLDAKHKYPGGIDVTWATWEL